MKDKGWLAGIIDGEGCLGITKKKTKNKYEAYLVITNTDKRVIDRCYKIVGYGRIRERKKTKNPNHKNQWELWFGANDCRKLLPEIKNLLIKKDQANVLLRMLKIQKCRGRMFGGGYGQKPRTPELSNELEMLYKKARDLKS